MDHWKQILQQGAVRYAEVLNDQSDLLAVGQLGSRFASQIQSQVVEGDVCTLCFTSMIIRPDVRNECLVAVMGDRLLLFWEQGLFKKKALSETVRLATVSDVSYGAGTTSATRGAQVVTVTHTSGRTQFALPVQNGARVGDVVAAVIRGEEIPGLPSPPELGSSGRPKEVEEGIARWFAFRRGEIAQDQVGIGAMALVRWMTDEEKAEDTRLLNAQKKD